MKHLKHDLGLRIVKFLAIVLAVVPFAACWYLFFADTIPYPYFKRGNWVILALFAALYVVFARIYDAFVISVNKPSELAYSQCLSVLIADGIMFVVLWLLNHNFPNLLPCVAALVVQLVALTIWAYSARKWYYAAFPAAKTAVILGRGNNLEPMIQEYGLDRKFDVQKTVTAAQCVEDLNMLEGFKTVFICDVQSHERNLILKYCIDRDIRVYVLPRIGDIIMSGAKRMHMFHLPILQVNRWNPRPEYIFFKRMFDILFSAVVLLVLSPVMVVTAVAVKLTDGGPVFYRQKRLTKDGKVFEVLKFRSMRVDAEKDGVARLSTGAKDDRITPVGRIIRKVRIDELPQLLNILGGSMSVVGPRPERPEIAKQYEKDLPEFRLRLQTKAGLTGYAQVYGKYNTTPYDKLQMDLMYIANPSFLEDLRIVLATVKIIFTPESTDGVAEGQTTAAKEKSEEKEPVAPGRK